jgi:hypothetical protein
MNPDEKHKEVQEAFQVFLPKVKVSRHVEELPPLLRDPQGFLASQHRSFIEWGINKLKAPQRILILEPSAGLLPLIAKAYGHNVECVESDRDPFHLECTKHSRVKTHVHTILEVDPLPFMKGKFDRILAKDLTFDNDPEWCPRKWIDLMENLVYLLNRGKELHLERSQITDNPWNSDDFKEYLEIDPSISSFKLEPLSLIIRRT